MKAPQVSGWIGRFTLNAGSFAALIASAIVLLFVLTGYVERDVVRVRGLVLGLMLLGMGLIVRSEARSYVPIPRRHSR